MDIEAIPNQVVILSILALVLIRHRPLTHPERHYQWTCSNKLRQLTGWQDVQPLFTEALHLHWSF